MVGQNKGTKGYIKHFESNFSMSFIVAISKDQLYGIIGAMQTTNSALFCRFLAEVINLHNKRFLENEKDLVLIMDNASIHKSCTTKEFINGHDLTILTTTPYCPCLNPVEKLILCIKNKIQKNQCNGRLLSLSLIRQVVDECSKIHPANFINQTRFETLQRLTCLIC